jgi:hypothetical protein
VASAASRHFAFSVISYSSTNRLSSWPCAIALYQGAGRRSPLSAHRMKSKSYGYHHPPREVTFLSMLRCPCAMARLRKNRSRVAR